jgi:asparagine synthase (glutamine-hydrolysing)
MPWVLGQVLGRDTVHEGLRRLKPLKAIAAVLQPRPRRAFSKVATLESALYMRNQLLRDADWAGMAHSIEIRVPLVDSVLLSNMAALLSRRALPAGKAVLARAPSSALPATIANRAKTGFATPVGTWLQHQASTTSFKHIPALASAGCPWARRWAYGIAAV